MDCKQAQTLLAEQVSHSLDESDRDQLEAHLRDCPACRSAGEDLQAQDDDLHRAFSVCAGSATHVAERALATFSRDPKGSADRAPKGSADPVERLRRRFGWSLAAALTAAAVALALHALYYPSFPTRIDSNHARTGPVRDYLTPRPRPQAPPVRTAAVGEEIRTGPNERRRVSLPDGSVLYVNQGSAVRLSADRQLSLTEGEVYVEVAPRYQGDRTPFLVKTSRREVSALGTKFAVRAEPAGTGVLVAQGKVKVDGREQPLLTGQRLPPDGEAVPAPRVSHALDWTRELMAAAESPLVPGSQYAGGALIAVDPSGQQAKLSLRRFHIDVHIEDGFARTTIDQTYFNHDPWRMEGTFYFPLPPDASLSRLAMYVDGRLMEGGMAERERARTVYEQIVHSQRDPALLEWVDGSTFKMRVFPLEGRQEKRIILSYTQRLPNLYGRTSYRFPSGHSLDLVRDWSFHARVKNGANLSWTSDSHSLRAMKDGADLLLDLSARNVKLDRDVSLTLTDTRSSSDDSPRFSTVEHEGARYLMLRYRPSLSIRNPQSAIRNPRHWVFLFESSGDRDPLLARAQVEALRAILANAEPEDTFAVLTAGTRVKVFDGERGASAPRGVTRATPENIQQALNFLDQSHLIGALDLGNALAAAAPYLKAGANPHLVHVGSGIPAMGLRREDELLKRLPPEVKYVGVGVGKRWGRNFMKAAAERSGGWFTQINPDEPIAWRGFELVATLNTPRLLDLRVTDDAGREYLTFANMLAEGEELCALTRIDTPGANAPGSPLPKTVTVTGTRNGEPVRHVLEVAKVASDAGYLPRTWAKLEIDRLLAADALRHREPIVELSKAMYVMTPFTSLLVLESDAMYEEFKVDRGRKDHWAMYPAPDKIEVVWEPDPLLPVDTRNAPTTSKPAASQVLPTIVHRGGPTFFERAGYREDDSREGNAFRRLADNRFHNWSIGLRLEVPVGASRPQTSTEVEQAIAVNINSFDPYSSVLAAGRDFQAPGEVFVLGDAVTSQNVVRRGRPSYFLSGGEVPIPSAPPFGGFPGSGGTPDIQERRAELLAVDTSESMRVIEEEWERIWFTDIPSVPVHGGIPTVADLKRRIDPADLSNLSVLPVYFRELGRVRKSPYHEALGKSLADLDDPVGHFDAVDAAFYLKDYHLPAPIESGLIASTTRGGRSGSYLYQRPSFNFNERLFFDLVGHAPGFQTSPADVKAVLEAEALPSKGSLPGRIDPAARKLIEGARSGGWRALVVNHGGLTPPARQVIVHFDGAGRFAYERRLPFGLREVVVCDGESLLHLYPELKIGARRAVSRFHSAELARLVPWLVPPAEDLARGADLKEVGEDTVAIVPRGLESRAAEERKWLEAHLVFDGSGRLSERRAVLQPEGQTLYRERYDPAGVVQGFDAKGKRLFVREFKLEHRPAPELQPDLSSLIVLPLPFRSREHVYRSFGLDPSEPLDHPDNGCWEYLDRDRALELFTAEVAQRQGERAAQIYRRYFAEQKESRLGFYTLLASCGASFQDDPDFAELIFARRREPLARYLALLDNRFYRPLQQTFGLNWADGPALKDSPFLHDLACFRDQYLRWHRHNADAGLPPFRRARQADAVGFVRQHQDKPLGFAMLCLLQDRAGADRGFHRSLAELWGQMAKGNDLNYLPRYEEARHLLEAGRRKEARQRFCDLYEAAFKHGLLPPTDPSFKEALTSDGRDADLWSGLLQTTADTLIAKNQRPAVLALAWQCWQLDDHALADGLAGAALQPSNNEGEWLATRLTAIAYFRETNRLGRADELNQSILSEPKLARQPSLWRLASQLADSRGHTLRAIDYLEKALDLEYPHLPAVINLESVRQDYGKLLDHYQWLAEAVTTLKVKPPANFPARVVKAADRWRALDREDTSACQRASRILKLLGARELAWDYLTTPIGLKPGESDPWLGMAKSLSQEGELDLAELAYQAAFDAEPTNAQTLWDRSQNLQRAGRTTEAQKALKQLADGEWQPRFSWIQSQARRQVR